MQRKENVESDKDIEEQSSMNDGVDSGENNELPEERNVPLALGKKAEKKTIQTVLDPEGPFIDKWNTIFVVSCVIAVLMDPLFFYIPIINEEKKCIEFDKTLRITTICLRSVTDLVYVLNIILQFLSPYIDEDFRRLGIIEWVRVTDAWEIALRYLLGYFIIDILAILPIPQVVMLIILPKMRGSKSLNKRKLLNSVVLLQYVPRFLRIFLSRQQLKAPGRFATTIFGQVAFNLAMYILVSHVVGAFWYFFSIERETACWHIACKNHTGCVMNSFNCDTSLGNYTFLNGLCPANTTDTTNTTLFDFGIFLEAIKSGILESTYFPQKFLHCFWWGLRNMSSFGQNLQTSAYLWENCFAVFISIFGLFAFLIFIGNLQEYMQKTERLRKIKRKMKVKKQDIESWMYSRDFPGDIKREINELQILEENENVEVEKLISYLPKYLRWDITSHFCLPLLEKVPMFQNMGEQKLLQLIICNNYLKPVYYKEHNYIIREGEPLDVILFITQGIVWTYTTSDSEKSGSLSAECLKIGDFYGRDLVDWGFNASSSPNLSKLPNSPKTVKRHTEVEAFALMANDLKTVVSKFQAGVSCWQTEADLLQAAKRRRQPRH